MCRLPKTLAAKLKASPERLHKLLDCGDFHCLHFDGVLYRMDQSDQKPFPLHTTERVTDVIQGDDGTVLYSTESGSIYRYNPRADWGVVPSVQVLSVPTGVITTLDFQDNKLVYQVKQSDTGPYNIYVVLPGDEGIQSKWLYTHQQQPKLAAIIPMESKDPKSTLRVVVTASTDLHVTAQHVKHEEKTTIRPLLYSEKGAEDKPLKAATVIGALDDGTLRFCQTYQNSDGSITITLAKPSDSVHKYAPSTQETCLHLYKCSQRSRTYKDLAETVSKVAGTLASAVDSVTTLFSWFTTKFAT